MSVKRWSLIILSLVTFACYTYVLYADAPLVATFINVGQGDSCWLRLPNGDDVLVDGGEPQAGPTVVAYLQQQGVTDIDLMVATHGDSDHIGGLLSVLDAMPVHEAWLDSQDCTTATCLDLYQAFTDHGVVTAIVRMGETHEWGAVTALVLNPSEPLYADKNENSVVLRIGYGTVDLLLTGDAETGAEGRMLSSGLPLSAEVLKVAHHGSNSSSSASFLSAVGPQRAIISVGPNSYGHPRAEVLQRLADVGAIIYRTDIDGTIVVSTDGVTYTVVRENQPTPLGDVNSDGLVDSTDALIVLSADAGMDTSQFCPMNCGDTNADGFVDSTDALVILSYDAGMTVPFPVGQPGCPSSVTQPPGCTP